MKRTTLVMLSAFGLLLCGAAAQQLPQIGEILRRLDDNYSQTTDVSARVSLTQQKPGQGTKAIDLLYYRRDSDQSFLIVMTAPETEKGNGYLRVGDNFWMYRRNTRTFQHINRDENIGGTNAKGENFEDRKLVDLYAPAADTAGREAIARDKLGQIPVYRLEVRGKVSDVDYPKKLFWVRQDNALLLKEQAFTSSGTLMQTAYYLKYTEINGRFVPVRQLFIDEFEKGNKTAVEISEISTQKLSDALFTKAYLENLSK
ncbi:MAG: outer membrane lipoprotein-sorting protein [Candidatus Edwardsbacteria bacterium]|jgi:outer membrane lipoprotein-sorting protein|nr:outer membrane lipoprotein-sorting protein [Candidatus Edwardsbacteria bacterium]